MKMMVVGGAGFIGSHLVDRLVAEGHTVDVVDDLSSGSLANLAGARELAAQVGELKIHHLDACAPELGSLVALRSPDVVYQLAALPPGRVDATTLARSLHSTLNVLEAARACEVGKVVTSLPAVALYGEVPARDLPIKEGCAWAPLGPVGVVAQALAELLRVSRERHGVEYTALATVNVYGPRQRPESGVVAAFAAAAAAGAAGVIHGDGRQTRDFLFIDDAVDAFVRAGARGSGLVVNIGTGTATSIRDLWVMVAGRDAEARVGVPRATDDVSRFAVSPVRARIHLAWAPWTDLAAGLHHLR